MATTYTRGSGISPDTSGAVISPSAEERAAWPLFASYASAKQALWIDPSSSRFYRKGASADLPASFKMVDRAGGRLFTPEPVRNRHPYIITDSVTGRPVWTFGAGGASPNALSDPFNGAQVNASILDALGAETNALPLFLPDTGWSIAFKARIPVPSTTVNGVAFGSNTGGCILGGAALDPNGPNSFRLSIDILTGFLRALNQDTATGANQFLAGSVDRRDSTWHDYVVTYDDTIGTYTAWTDGASSVQVTGCTTDISTVSGASKPIIGGFKGAAAGVSDRLFGFLAFLAYLPSPALAISANRTLIRNLMATR